MLHLKGTGDLALRWEVARVWRLGRQTNYVIVSAQYTLSPARTQGIGLLIGEKQNHHRLLCSSRQHRVLHHLIKYITSWPLVPLRHSQWKTC
jgi:hypothetical protein